MPYELEPLARDEFDRELAELPDGVRASVEGLLEGLSIEPWTSAPMNEANPGGQYRFLAFASSDGYGFVTFVVLEAERRVSLVNLLWFPER
ncbi:hypothetical protein [Actinomycetospora straminea]|uniref:Uncharacterized protein n=1 Tax=Actinomycetospora straminea TaxID=663607 RepID=A0ABP9F4B2_9PSEU|nr:hypothetical protein [Actinomycetospora straminea]MDD7934725.1 hypothetical protein [Actinomycetospora straminea]